VYVTNAADNMKIQTAKKFISDYYYYLLSMHKTA